MELSVQFVVSSNTFDELGPRDLFYYCETIDFSSISAPFDLREDPRVYDPGDLRREENRQH